MVSYIERLIHIGNELSGYVSRLVTVASPGPKWDDNQGANRHLQMDKNPMLFCLTKLAGATSTSNAMLSLVKEGFWFQAAILARCSREATLSIAFMLSNPTTNLMDLPEQSQKAALSEYYRETWNDPDRPFDETSQRSQIGLKKLSAALGHFQTKGGQISSHDAGQVALQSMCFLSDYTHMAYPRLMELYQKKEGYELSGGQSTCGSFNLDQATSVIDDCCNMASCLVIILIKILETTSNSASKPTPEHLIGKNEILYEICRKFEYLTSILESEFRIIPLDAKKLIKTMKGNYEDRKIVADTGSQI
jgi:hypothetical protein